MGSWHCDLLEMSLFLSFTCLQVVNERNIDISERRLDSVFMVLIHDYIYTTILSDYEEYIALFQIMVALGLNSFYIIIVEFSAFLFVYMNIHDL